MDKADIKAIKARAERLYLIEREDGWLTPEEIHLRHDLMTFRGDNLFQDIPALIKALEDSQERVGELEERIASALDCIVDDLYSAKAYLKPYKKGGGK